MVIYKLLIDDAKWKNWFLVDETVGTGFEPFIWILYTTNITTFTAICYSYNLCKGTYKELHGWELLAVCDAKRYWAQRWRWGGFYSRPHPSATPTGV